MMERLPYLAFSSLALGTYFTHRNIVYVKCPDCESDGKQFNAYQEVNPDASADALVSVKFFDPATLVQVDEQKPKARWA